MNIIIYKDDCCWFIGNRYVNSETLDSLHTVMSSKLNTKGYNVSVFATCLDRGAYSIRCIRLYTI